MKLRNDKILVFGGGSGIGKSIAKRFCDAGATFTPMIAHYAHHIDQKYERHAIERYIRPEKIAELAFYLMGAINESEVKACLCHEHICCFSEYLFKMAGKAYLDMEKLASKSISELKRLKDTYGMNLFVDCTPINI